EVRGQSIDCGSLRSSDGVLALTRPGEGRRSTAGAFGPVHPDGAAVARLTGSVSQSGRVPVMLPYEVRARLHRVRTRVERATRVLLGSAPSWKRRPNILPWFD